MITHHENYDTILVSMESLLATPVWVITGKLFNEKPPSVMVNGIERNIGPKSCIGADDLWGYRVTIQLAPYRPIIICVAPEAWSSDVPSDLENVE